MNPLLHLGTCSQTTIMKSIVNVTKSSLRRSASKGKEAKCDVLSLSQLASRNHMNCVPVPHF